MISRKNKCQLDGNSFLWRGPVMGKTLLLGTIVHLTLFTGSLPGDQPLPIGNPSLHGRRGRVTCWTKKQKAWDFSEAQILCQFFRAPKTTSIWWVAQAVEKTAFGVAALQKTTFQQTVSMIWGYPGGFFPQTFINETSLYFSLPPPMPPPQKNTHTHTHTLVSGQNGNKYFTFNRFALKCFRKISDFQKNLAALGRP